MNLFVHQSCMLLFGSPFLMQNLIFFGLQVIEEKQEVISFLNSILPKSRLTIHNSCKRMKMGNENTVLIYLVWPFLSSLL